MAARSRPPRQAPGPQLRVTFEVLSKKPWTTKLVLEADTMKNAQHIGRFFRQGADQIDTMLGGIAADAVAAIKKAKRRRPPRQRTPAKGQ